jgi:DNA-binding transcriptional MerR regulator
MTSATAELLPIGRFSRLTGVTVKALRHYDAIGLLEPAAVDPETGYRFYTLAQARDAVAVRRLRDLDVPLDEIRTLVTADELGLRGGLAAHRARLEARRAATDRRLAEVNALIDGKETLVPDRSPDVVHFQLDVRELAEQPVVGKRERVRSDELSSAIPRGIAEVHGFLDERRIRPVGPPITICPFPDADDMIEIANTRPVAEEVEADPPIESWTLPAARVLWMRHRGPYERLPDSYRMLEEVIANNGLEPVDAPREIYVTDPEEVADPADYVTEIAWPIGPDGRLPARGTEDVFTRRVEPSLQQRRAPRGPSRRALRP